MAETLKSGKISYQRSIMSFETSPPREWLGTRLARHCKRLPSSMKFGFGLIKASIVGGRAGDTSFSLLQRLWPRSLLIERVGNWRYAEEREANTSMLNS